ncbi:phage tail assembly protein [Chromobacterium alkanivorans]|uniref:phage tail assembly protein n=1 Tax=Chromobacterium alkanivorans TaxID=1071719 RepID=UPI001968301C|nr:phage tail assembly protein [Chromobacterium alkanivorans]MBN3005593.1 phage tail assembly protein [Chromobacterium alkanivorans]
MSTNKTITLDTPIKRGDETITILTLRKPAAGELRGCNLTDLLQMDVAALQRVLPRITTPTLTEQEVGRMDPADLLQLGTEVSGFLLPKGMKPEAFQAE